MSFFWPEVRAPSLSGAAERRAQAKARRGVPWWYGGARGVWCDAVQHEGCAADGAPADPLPAVRGCGCAGAASRDVPFPLGAPTDPARRPGPASGLSPPQAPHCQGVPARAPAVCRPHHSTCATGHARHHAPGRSACGQARRNSDAHHPARTTGFTTGIVHPCHNAGSPPARVHPYHSFVLHAHYHFSCRHGCASCEHLAGQAAPPFVHL